MSQAFPRGENEDFVQGGGALAPAPQVARDGAVRAPRAPHHPAPLPLHHAEKPLYSNILIANSTLPGSLLLVMVVLLVPYANIIYM